jgi:hypothetical protein
MLIVLFCTCIAIRNFDVQYTSRQSESKYYKSRYRECRSTLSFYFSVYFNANHREGDV